MPTKLRMVSAAAPDRPRRGPPARTMAAALTSVATTTPSPASKPSSITCSLFRIRRRQNASQATTISSKR
jgi:hypothetical protein